MRKGSLKPIFLVSLLLLGGGTAFGQGAPDAPPAGDERPQTPEETARLKQINELAEQQMIDKLLQLLNPAYRPLFPLFRGLIQGGYSAGNSGLVFPKDLYASPLAEVKTFLDQSPIKTTLAVTGDWIRNFHGLDPNFKSPDAGGEEDDVSTSLMPPLANLLIVGWGAEQRLQFAGGRNDLALDQLEESLRFFEIMGAEDFATRQSADDSLRYTPAFFARHLASFTPHQCARLIGISERWKTLTDVPDALLDKAMQEEQEALMQEVQNDGSVPDREAEARQAQELQRKLDEGEQIPEEPATELPVSAPLPPTPEALQKRKQVADAVAQTYARLRILLRDPFAALPPKPTYPKWLEGIVSTGYNGYGETNLPEYRQIRVRLSMLQAHAAIRQFRWEHDRLPVSLAELQNPKRMTDPASGRFFNYSTDGDTYTLTSVGVAGFEFDAMGNPLPGKPYDILKVDLANPEFMMQYVDTATPDAAVPNPSETVPPHRDE